MFGIFYYDRHGNFIYVQRFDSERKALDFCEENGYTLDMADSKGGMFCICKV